MYGRKGTATGGDHLTHPRAKAVAKATDPARVEKAEGRDALTKGASLTDWRPQERFPVAGLGVPARGGSMSSWSAFSRPSPMSRVPSPSPCRSGLTPMWLR